MLFSGNGLLIACPPTLHTYEHNTDQFIGIGHHYDVTDVYYFTIFTPSNPFIELPKETDFAQWQPGVWN